RPHELCRGPAKTPDAPEDPVRSAVRRWIQVNDARDRVARQERQIDPLVAGVADVVVYLLCPVFVVTDGQPALGPQQTLAVDVRVDVRDVGYVVAFLLHPEGEGEFPQQELARPVADGEIAGRQPVQIDAVRAVEADVVPRAG